MNYLTTERRPCLDAHKGGCEGAVEYRPSLSGTGTPIPRCDKHWADRLDDQAAHDKKYPVLPPKDFDYLDAGEHWGDDY